VRSLGRNLGWNCEGVRDLEGARYYQHVWCLVLLSCLVPGTLILFGAWHYYLVWCLAPAII
jgi:hypothetical protein